MNLRAWLLPLACTAVILTLGSSLFAFARTSAIFVPLISSIRPGLGPFAMFEVQAAVRRSAHVLEYATLFLVLARGPLRGRPLVAFFACIAVAALDESLQMLTPARSGLLSDVAEDATGAALAMVLLLPYWDHQRDLRLNQ